VNHDAGFRPADEVVPKSNPGGWWVVGSTSNRSVSMYEYVRMYASKYAWYSVKPLGVIAHCNYVRLLHFVSISECFLGALSLISPSLPPPSRRLPLRFRELYRSAPDGCERSGYIVNVREPVVIPDPAVTSKARNCTRITAKKFSHGSGHRMA